MSSPTSDANDSSKESAKPIDPLGKVSPVTDPNTKKPAPIRTGRETD